MSSMKSLFPERARSGVATGTGTDSKLTIWKSTSAILLVGFVISLGFNYETLRQQKIRLADQRTILLLRHIFQAQNSRQQISSNGGYATELWEVWPQWLERDVMCTLGVENEYFIQKYHRSRAQFEKSYTMTRFQVTEDTNPSKSTFYLTLEPTVKAGLFQTGSDCFYLDQTGAIRHSGSAHIAAGPHSPLLDEFEYWHFKPPFGIAADIKKVRVYSGALIAGFVCFFLIPNFPMASSLQRCFEDRCTQTLKLYLSMGLNPNTTLQDETPLSLLYWAILNGNEAQVTLLLDYGANPNDQADQLLWHAEIDYATSYSSDFTGVSHFTDNLDELKLYHLHIPYCARGTWACFEKPETLKALGKANLDRLFESHQISELRVVPATLMTQPQFSITLEPRIRWWPFRTGMDCYFIDQTGVIRHLGSAFVKAHAQSSPLEVKSCE